MNYIVSTTINPPTEALRRFAAMPGWKLVVAGDLQTPEWNIDGAVYLDPKAQDEIDQPLSDLIGWRCIQRRMMAVVYALRAGADLIATVDDDNLPDATWADEVIAGMPGTCRVYRCAVPAFDPFSVTAYPHLWHRGYPIQWLAQRGPAGLRVQTVQADVHAMLWNGDPDVDAICRMEHAPQCEFSRPRLPFSSDKPMPFNSQNTVLTAAAARDWFCFPGVGRADDIWAAYVCQARGHRCVFTGPTVTQTRVGHDVTDDFVNEQVLYTKTHLLIEALAKDAEAWRVFVPERSVKAFDRYREIT